MPGIETQQHPWELKHLEMIVNELSPASILEIGAWQGGTLMHWLRPHRSVTVIDEAMRRAELWREWARDVPCELRLIHGDSRDPLVVEEARDGYDFVFIDADHRYDAVKADWEHYSTMVVPGGILAFHDIRNYEHGQVGDLWAEIKPYRRTVEIVDMTVDEPWGGIGVVWL